MSGLAKKQAGFSMLELIVVIGLISTLLVVALSRLAGYVREAERVAVLTMEGQIRNVLVMESAKRILNPGGPTLLALAHSNPMELMLETPVNYLGVLRPEQAREVPGRHWYFDGHNDRLVYRTGADLTGVYDGDLQEIRYDVQVAFNDRDGDGSYTAARDELVGVRLHRLGGDGWLRLAQNPAAL
ncbi:MAG: type II secretion system protein [Gammaproteobacteria bacterium]|nr:type II secretion system protein [Gammaproteobacteria bacterium]NNF60015.1 type II secretion system protein [Gammaproteobacteria bacterium]NNM20081.1 type II secretion system protein [Gammaproteobacteria bacterium]